MDACFFQKFSILFFILKCLCPSQLFGTYSPVNFKKNQQLFFLGSLENFFFPIAFFLVLFLFEWCYLQPDFLHEKQIPHKPEVTHNANDRILLQLLDTFQSKKQNGKKYSDIYKKNFFKTFLLFFYPFIC